MNNTDENLNTIMEGSGMLKNNTSGIIKEHVEEEKVDEYLLRNSNIEEGESVDGRMVLIVPKANSLTNVKYKVFQDDYLNENKSYVLDMFTGTLVLNPNRRK